MAMEKEILVEKVSVFGLLQSLHVWKRSDKNYGYTDKLNISDLLVEAVMEMIKRLSISGMDGPILTFLVDYQVCEHFLGLRAEDSPAIISFSRMHSEGKRS